MTITARTGIWVQAGWMEHRGVPHAIRIGIGRDQWCVAVYPPGSKFPAERAVVGTREEAEATARSMINALLKKAIGAEALAAPEPILPLEERWTMTTAAEFRAKADQCE